MSSPSPEQLAVCYRAGVEPDVPLAGEKIGIALTTSHLAPLNALRHPAENRTCGWYVWGGEASSDSSDFFAPLHVAHIGEYVQNLVPYIALRPGWRVLLAHGQEDVWFDKGLLHVQG